MLDKFKSVVTESYHSEAIPIDFTNIQEAMMQVNKQVERQSYGHIVQVVRELPLDTVLALVNYIYFEGKVGLALGGQPWRSEPWGSSSCSQPRGSTCQSRQAGEKLGRLINDNHLGTVGVIMGSLWGKE